MSRGFWDAVDKTMEYKVKGPSFLEGLETLTSRGLHIIPHEGTKLLK